MRFSISDEDGGMGGSSWNCSNAPTAVIVLRTAMIPKYSSRPSPSVTMAPPTKNAVAIPIWLKFSATAVLVARSDGANHVADKTGGVHWKKGCAAPTITVPKTMLVYDIRCSAPGMTGKNDVPDRNQHPTAMSTAAACTAFCRPNLLTISVTKKQVPTLVNRKISIIVAAECLKAPSYISGAAATEKHIQSDNKARADK